eukprot:COSAG06_NODE_18245_length_896_cov_1.513174_2_plen_141_part_00
MPFLHAYLRFGDGLSMEKSDGESVGWPPPPPPPPPLPLLLLLLRLPRGNADLGRETTREKRPLVSFECVCVFPCHGHICHGPEPVLAIVFRCFLAFLSRLPLEWIYLRRCLLAPRMDLFQAALAPRVDLFQVSLLLSIPE